VHSLNKAKQSKKAVLVSCNGPFYKQKGYDSLICGGDAT
jgi:tRNA1(Val) A37 N6-methylase TrmN6